VLQAISWLITALLLLYSITLFTLALLTNMYRSDQLGDDTEKQKRADPPMNAFFIDASALRFFGCSRTVQERNRPGVPLQRANTRISPLFAGTHPYWATYNHMSPSLGGDTSESKRMTSTVDSITRTYTSSPLQRPRRAAIPSQSPYSNTRRDIVTGMSFCSPKRQVVKGFE